MRFAIDLEADPPRVLQDNPQLGAEWLAVMAYHSGAVSSGEAAEMIGLDRVSFEEKILPQHHIPRMDARCLADEQAGLEYLKQL